MNILKSQMVIFYLVPVALITLICMTIYEAVKSLLLPGITIWESHLITISFVTILATLLAYLVILKLRSEQGKADEARSRLGSIVESSDDAIIGKTLDGVITSWNTGAKMIYGHGADEMIGKPITVLAVPDRVSEMLATLDKIRLSGGISHLETVHRRKDGSQINVSLTVSPIKDRSGRIAGASTIARDVTEQRQREELLAKTLVEKELLLKEIHHRVKNNMQIISSLLNLQILNSKAAGDITALKESQSRIKSMALIHEKLYGSKDLSMIDLAEYTESLARGLMQTYSINGDRVKLKLKLSGVLVDIDTAIPYGLIVNELVTNSLKYAFPGGTAGEITIELNSGDLVSLTVKDDGVGFPAGLDLANSPSLGMQLIHSLADQLQGTIVLENRNGSRAEISFPRTTRDHHL